MEIYEWAAMQQNIDCFPDELLELLKNEREIIRGYIHLLENEYVDTDTSFEARQEVTRRVRRRYIKWEESQNG